MNITAETNAPKVGDLVKVHGDTLEILAIKEEERYWQQKETKYVIAIVMKDGGQISVLRGVSQTKLQEMLDPQGEAQEPNNLPKSRYGTLQERAKAMLDMSTTPADGTSQESKMLLKNTRAYGIIGYELCDEAKVTFKPLNEVDGISLYLNAKDAKRGRRTKMKAGRAFKHMFPNASTKVISELTETWKETNAPRELVLKVGTSRKAFRRAYCGIRADYRNPKTTSFRKNLSTSCMHAKRVQVNGEDISPAEAYASGDFSVAWLETPNKKIAGRVVFSNDNGSYAPIYGACEQSIDMLEDYMKSRGVQQGEKWKNLKLLAIEYEDEFVAPYLDCDYGAELEDGFLVLKEYGKINFDSTDGVTTSGETCADCGESGHIDEMMWAETGLLCRYCFENSYVEDDNGNIIHVDEAVEAACLIGSSIRWSWVRHDEATYCEHLDQYWIDDEVIGLIDGTFIPEHRMEDFQELLEQEDEY